MIDDAPDIKRTLETGYPREVKQSKYICPICKSELYETDDIYLDKFHDIAGCTFCIDFKEAWEVLKDEND